MNRFASLAVAAVLFLVAYGVAAAEIGIVKADGTAIHESASKKAARIGVVDRMGPVDVLEKGKEWIKVRDRSLGVEGWMRLSSVYLSGDPLSSISEPREDTTCKLAPPVTLKMDGDRFDCDKDILGEGYKQCTLSLTVRASSPCMNAIEVFPNCTAEVKAKFAGAFMDKTLFEYAKGHFIVEGGSGYGYVQIYFSKPFAMEDWVYAKVLDARCRAGSFAF